MIHSLASPSSQEGGKSLGCPRSMWLQHGASRQEEAGLPHPTTLLPAEEQDVALISHFLPSCAVPGAGNTAERSTDHPVLSLFPR